MAAGFTDRADVCSVHVDGPINHSQLYTFILLSHYTPPPFTHTHTHTHTHHSWRHAPHSTAPSIMAECSVKRLQSYSEMRVGNTWFVRTQRGNTFSHSCEYMYNCKM